MTESKKNNRMEIVDENFIKELCESTWETIYRYIYYKVQNKEEAEDITQETYYKAVLYMQKNDINMDTIVGFLKTISLNILRDKWRKNNRQGVIVNFDDVRQEETSVKDCTEELVKRDIILGALKLLNEEQRTVIDLRILKGYSVAETAKKMNKKEVTVRGLQFRALKKLSRILKDQ